MSDIVIRSGGVVEVDTASLRAVAARLRSVADDSGDQVRRLDTVIVELAGAPPDGPVLSLDAALLRADVARAADDATSIAAALEETATLYETVELLVARDAAMLAGDDAAAARSDARLAQIRAESPETHLRALDALAEGPRRGDLWSQGFVTAGMFGADGSRLYPFVFALLPGVVDVFRRGVVGAHERLSGPAVPVRVQPLSSAPAAPAASLADVAARVPGGDQARVRVERYAMPAGASQYVVYVAGTQTLTGRDPFDMRSSAELYLGQRSASYDAVVAALEDAGAKPGDVVHAVGHSQGAMIGERLALEGRYEMRSVVSFGGPVHADVPDTTLSVSLRHTDDPVAALASGGQPVAAGTTGSIVVERSADPTPALHDLRAEAHHMSAYADTAAMLDASSDPRVDAVRSLFDELAAAQSVTATEYAAERADGVSRRPASGGG